MKLRKNLYPYKRLITMEYINEVKIFKYNKRKVIYNLNSFDSYN